MTLLIQLQPESKSMSATVLGFGCETFPYENPGESSLLTMDNPLGEVAKNTNLMCQFLVITVGYIN